MPFHSWLWEFSVHLQQSKTFFIQFFAKMFYTILIFVFELFCNQLLPIPRKQLWNYLRLIDNKVSIQTQVFHLKMKKKDNINQIWKKFWIYSKSNIIGTKSKSTKKSTTKLTANPRRISLWYISWKNTKSIHRRGTHFCRSFFIWANSSWKWPFEKTLSKKNRAANQILRKQKMEAKQKLQRLNQIVVQNDRTLLAFNQKIPSTSKRVPSQQVARSEISLFNPFIFLVMTERQKRAFF